jgi:hypothetical protein
MGKQEKVAASVPVVIELNSAKRSREPLLSFFLKPLDVMQMRPELIKCRN